MTVRSMKAVALVVVTAAATALLMQACGGDDAVAQSAPLSDVDPIQGVWDSTVTNKDCTSGAVNATSKVLVIIHRGGTVEVDSFMQRASRTDIYGIWKRGVGSAYTADVIHLRSNPDGTLAGSNKIRRTLTLSADTNAFSGTLAIQFVDTAGAVTGAACATETATRVTW